MTFRFLSRRTVEALHEMQISRFGGSLGLRDHGGFESALSRPLIKANYGCEDIHELAAAYLYGFTKNHPFIDGNKRIGITAAAVFLRKNGYESMTSTDTLYEFVHAVADGKIGEAGATVILRGMTRRIA